jgi:hypothetical protein
MRRKLEAAALVAFTPAFAQEDKPLPAGMFLDLLHSQFVQTCQAIRADLAVVEPGIRDQKHMKETFTCDCMIPGLEKLKDDKEIADRLVTQDKALELVKTVLDRCGGLMMREQLLTQCDKPQAAEKDVKDQAAFCSCLRTEAAKHSDAALTDDAMAMYQDFEARVQARKESKPAPPKHRGPLHAMQNTCRAAQGAPPLD